MWPSTKSKKKNFSTDEMIPNQKKVPGPKKFNTISIFFYVLQLILIILRKIPDCFWIEISKTEYALQNKNYVHSSSQKSITIQFTTFFFNLLGKILWREDKEKRIDAHQKINQDDSTIILLDYCIIITISILVFLTIDIIVVGKLQQQYKKTHTPVSVVK